MRLVPSRRPLVAPLRLAFGTLAHREGALLRLDDGAGRTGWGDVCPLPGFSPDTLAEALASLHAWHASGDDSALTPSARAALDGARLDLDAQAQGAPMAEALRPGAASTVALQALLVGDGPVLLERACAVRTAGYEVAKLKVGALLVDEDVARLHACLLYTSPSPRD